MVFHKPFFEWAWDRHHNMLSWYIRPFALLPYMFFAYKKSLAGMAFSVFALLTSMAWFPKPEIVAPEVLEFLAMEREYLSQDLNLSYVLLWLTVPLTFVLLGMAFWKRSFLYGSLVLTTSVVLKMAWSVAEGGESGWTLVKIATFGLLVSLALIFVAKRLTKIKN